MIDLIDTHIVRTEMQVSSSIECVKFIKCIHNLRSESMIMAVGAPTDVQSFRVNQTAIHC